MVSPFTSGNNYTENANFFFNNGLVDPADFNSNEGLPSPYIPAIQSIVRMVDMNDGSPGYEIWVRTYAHGVKDGLTTKNDLRNLSFSIMIMGNTRRRLQTKSDRFRPLSGRYLQHHAVQRTPLVYRCPGRQGHYPQLRRPSGSRHHRVSETVQGGRAG